MSLLHRTRHDDRQGHTQVVDRPADDRGYDDTMVDERRHHDRSVVTTDHGDNVTKERSWTFAPGQLVSLIVGVGAVALGLVAMLRAGIDGSFDEPVVDVLGFSHTAWLGLAEVGLGVLLILAGTGAWGRPLSVLLGAGMVIAGVLVVAETSAMPEELGLEKDYGWGLILLGALVALAALVLPVWRSRRVRHNGVDVDADHSRATAH